MTYISDEIGSPPQQGKAIQLIKNSNKLNFVHWLWRNYSWLAYKCGKIVIKVSEGNGVFESILVSSPVLLFSRRRKQNLIFFQWWDVATQWREYQDSCQNVLVSKIGLRNHNNNRPSCTAKEGFQFPFNRCVIQKTIKTPHKKHSIWHFTDRNEHVR